MKANRGLSVWIPVLGILAAFGFLAGCEDSVLTPGPSVMAEAPISETVDLTTQTTLRILAINGTVVVEGSGTTPRIEVRGYRRVYSDTEEDAEDRLQDLRVELTAGDQEVLIRTRQPKDSEGRDYVVDYTVILPPDLSVKVVQANGPIRVEDVSGAVAATTANGDIAARDLHGDAVLHTINGRVTVDTAVTLGATLKIAAVNGSLQLTIPDQTSAWVSASTSNGRISHSGLVFSDLTGAKHTLSGQLGTGEGVIELRTTNGNVTLTGE